MKNSELEKVFLALQAARYERIDAAASLCGDSYQRTIGETRGLRDALRAIYDASPYLQRKYVDFLTGALNR